MPRQYVALLRAITNVAMQPFRQAMEELGFTDVASFGISGNLLFNADRGDPTSFEPRIAGRLNAVTFVRTRAELAKVARAPFIARPGAAVLFLSGPPRPVRRRAFLTLDFEAPRPVLRGRTLYYVYPARLRGKRTPFDFERALGVQGTVRSARVVSRLLALMSESGSKARKGVGRPTLQGSDDA